MSFAAAAEGTTVGTARWSTVRPVPGTGISTLTPAELRVLDLLSTHLSLVQIARELGVSRNTVKSQVSAIYRKLAAADRDQAVRRAREEVLPPARS
ncbi:MAG TPA: LuxR C-terminal-related transcriptional regulator [Kineosporiaceae bacterium]|nr:LuxR C-terminal-related transcriptional regulator [Kineosporiaceae bacterium]